MKRFAEFLSISRGSLLLLSFILTLNGFSDPSINSADTRRQPVPAEYLQCTLCHGVSLGGNFGVRAPRISGLPGWYVINQLQNFKRSYRGWHESDLYGLDMQPIAAAMNEKTMRQASEFVVNQLSPPPADVFSVLKDKSADSERGRVLYASCAVCHGDNGQGNITLQAPPLTIQNDWYLVVQLRQFRDGLRGGVAGDARGAQMMAAAKTLSGDEEILDVVAYITSLSRSLIQQN